jgi:hypothetical protein
MPDHLVRKVLVEGIVDIGILIKTVGLEPCSKCGVPIFISLKNFLKGISARIENNRLLVGKMNSKTQNTRFIILDFKKVKMPVGLIATNIACIQVKLDLILGSAKLHSGMIMALVDKLVDVLDSFDRGNGLHIDMTPVLPDEILAVTDNPSVVDLMCSVSLSCLNVLPCVMTSCPGIGVFSNAGVLKKRLGKSFGACAILHTG